MEQKIKEIVARYTKLPEDQIQPGTVIDRSAMPSSILLHRMYASLATAGIVVENYWDIKTYGTLLQKVESGDPQQTATNFNTLQTFNNEPIHANGQTSIGIDIEEISMLPAATDYREDAFYTMHFAPQEIAYCILQSHPQASFAGLFAAKEAIVKADNSYLKVSFNSIIIDHLPNGKPTHPQFSISISHTAGIAVAVAVPLLVTAISPPPGLPSSTPNLSVLYFFAFAALVLSLLSILIKLF